VILWGQVMSYDERFEMKTNIAWNMHLIVL